jgi:hypothetical protein
MQILPPDRVAEDAPKRLMATDPVLFAAFPQILFEHRCPAAANRWALLPGGSAEHHEKRHWPVNKGFSEISVAGSDKGFGGGGAGSG